MVTETEPFLLGGYAVWPKQPEFVPPVHLPSTYAEATSPGCLSYAVGIHWTPWLLMPY